MRAAALYDIHGNFPALEAVLAEVPADAAIVIGGDVALGGFPSETLERLRALGERVLWVRGNCDRELTPGETGFASEAPLEWVRSRLSDEQIKFLHGLPPLLKLEIDGLGQVLFCHASPQNDVDIFVESTPEEHVTPLFRDVSADLVVVGHTHVQYERRVGRVRVVNAGSVGMAYEDEPGAYWALLGPRAEHKRTQFTPRESEFPGWGKPRPSRTEYLARAARLAVGASARRPGPIEIDVLDKLNAHRQEQLVELFSSAWWTAKRRPAAIKHMLAGTDVLVALVDRSSDRLVGFARAITDQTFLAVILDVIVDPCHRKTGLGARLMDEILSRPELANIESVELICQPDLVDFYRRWGFTDAVGRSLLMRRSANPTLSSS